MKIVIGSDHGGFELKSQLKMWLREKKYEVIDVGCNSEDRCDYADFGFAVAEAVAGGLAGKGVLICGSGIGVCIGANRIKKARAAVLRIEEDAQLSRTHNDANIACFGARLTDFTIAKKLLHTFLTTPFEGGRHQGRIEKLDS